MVSQRRVEKGDDLYLIPAEGDPLPPVGSAVRGVVEDERRTALMRTHSSLHVPCGVVFRDFGALVVPKRIVGAEILELPGCAEELGVYQPPDLPRSPDLPRRCALPARGGLAVVQGEVIEASEVSRPDARAARSR